MRPIIRRMLCAFLLLCLLPVTALGESSSAVQIRNGGGSAARDGVTLSKTIHPTQTENLFDITLEVTTPFSLETLRQAEDAAVVMVTDISGTMNQLLSRQDLPRRVRRNLRQLGMSLGRFDLEGQLQGLEAVRRQCRQDLAALEENSGQRLRNYQTLALCAGAGLAILFV